MDTHHHILLVDDDQALLDLLAEFLRGDGFDVSTASSASDAASIIASRSVAARDAAGEQALDVMVLDIMMPGQSGLDFLKELRLGSQLPVIMLTGRGDDIDRIVGLELGADDYLAKPCNPRELSARIKAILRRTKTSITNDAENCLRVGGLSLDKARLRALVGQDIVSLTATEFRVLALLAERAGQTISKETLTQTILNRKLSPYDRSMDVHISRIRQKLSSYPLAKVTIQSIRSLGYQLSADNPVSPGV